MATRPHSKHRITKKLPTSVLKAKDLPHAYLLIIPGVLVIGIITKLLVFGAGTTVSFQPEDGGINTPATSIDDNTASNNTAVRFDAPGVTTPPPSPPSGPTPLPTATAWTNATGNLAGMLSECGDLTNVFKIPNSSAIIAGVAQLGLWTNIGGGTTWARLGTGSGSDTITNRPSTITYDPSNLSIFYESGIYNGGGVYKTTNSGTTLKQLGNVSHNDSLSIDFTDPNRQTMVAGGHEQGQTVYKTTNGGTTWTNIGGNIPATGFSTEVVAVNASTYIVGVTNTTGSGGIYRTTNGGSSWQHVATSVDSTLGTPLVTSKGVIYYVVGGYNGDHLVRSSDNGATWTEVGGSGSAVFAPVELTDGRIVSISHNNRLTVSGDGGSSWTEFGPTLPYTANSLTFSPGNNAFYISHFNCTFDGNDRVPNDGIMRLK